MTFLPHLRELIERATPRPWGVFAQGSTVEIGFADTLGERPCVIGWPGFDSNDQRVAENKRIASLIVHLANNAEAIAEVVEAAQKVVANAALVCDEEIELEQALAKLNGEQT